MTGMQRRQQLLGIALMVISFIAAGIFGGALIGGHPSRLAAALSLGMPLGLDIIGCAVIFAAGAGLARSRR